MIVYDQVDVNSDMNIKTAAQDTLSTALQSGTYSQVGENLVYGNSLGHTVLAERDEYRSRLNALETMMLSMQGKMARQDEVNSELRAQVEELGRASERFKQIRSRFLDTFRRDILEDPTARWTSAIGAGNQVAHNGNAVADARLYNDGFRDPKKDESLMVKVYGLNHTQILELCKLIPLLLGTSKKCSYTMYI